MIPSPRPPALPLPGPVWLGLLAAVAAAAVAGQVAALPGHLFDATRFILYDPGSGLYALGRWQAGDRLYTDFAWQYGPLALGWYRPFAALGGNTPALLVLGAGTAFALAWAVLADLLVRLGGWRAGGAAALVLLPVLNVSGPLLLNGLHGAVELLLLALVARTLSLPSGPRGDWTLGVLTGLLQAVRFGPHAVALVVVLALRGVAARGDRGCTVGRLLAGYALVALPLAAWYFRALPAAGAWEMLWPVHMAAHYAATYQERWPGGDVVTLLQFWLPAVAAAGLGVGGLVGLARTRAEPGPVLGLWFFPLYLLVGAVLLFRNANTLAGHAWLAWPALLGAVVAAEARHRRVLAAVVLLPAAWWAGTGVVGLFRTEAAWQAEPLALPNGQRLWFHGAEARQFGALGEALGTLPPSRRLAVVSAGGGVHHFFRTQPVGRHWWLLPEFIRPWEAERAQADLLAHDALFVADMGQEGTAAGGAVVLRLPFSAETNAALLPRLAGPRPVAGLGVLVRVGPAPR